MKVTLTLSLLLVLVLAHRADAYPQFQLSREPTCTGCHLAPDGGGLLNENGIVTAESISWKPGNGQFMYGALDLPSWLQLGGDARGAAGYVNDGLSTAAAYPMQLEVAGAATWKGLSFNAVGGLRQPQDGGNVAHVFWAREYYLMWQQKPGETEGLYIRAGRLMPTYGLRLAEHIVYTQKFGARPLYGEAYAAAVSYVTKRFEVHGTGFIHDPIASEVEHGDGGAFYGEVRLGDHAAVGGAWKYSTSDDQNRMFGGIVGKLYLPGPELLFQGEGELISQHITAGAGDRATALAGYVMATRMFEKGIMLDVGVGHYTQDTRVNGLFRDCLDVNVHWFMTSHIEWLFTGRVELLDFGSDTTGGFALAQLHYRL